MTATNPGTSPATDPSVHAPALAGIHHLKLPVSDLARSLEWYRSRLGYQVQIEFVEQGALMGCGLAHPAGGPDLGLRLDPDRARAAAGFDYFAIGVPDKAAIDRLARRLDELGQPHAGVHRASMGWILPEVLDPDGHTLRFYTSRAGTRTGLSGILAVGHGRRAGPSRCRRSPAFLREERVGEGDPLAARRPRRVEAGRGPEPLCVT